MATQPNFRHGLGDEVKDKVTGYTGIVISRTEFLNACRRYGVQSQGLKDGKPIDAVWFDEDNLVLITASKINDKLTKETGGDGPEVPRAPDASR